MKPNLFIVGAPKCGTSAWVHYLSAHPDIFFSPMKEPHHFNCDFPNYRWIKSRDEYLRLFEGNQAAPVIGEASVQYLYSQSAAQAIAEFNPSAKIMIFIRNHEDFSPSLHNQLVFNGDETIQDFELAWQLSGKRDHRNVGWFCREKKLLDYKSTGKFSEQIERYFAHFPPEQVRVFHFDDWTKNPRETYLEIMSFLGIEDDGRNEFPVVNDAGRRRINWLTPILRRPPSWSVKAAELLKRMLGVDELRILDRLLRLNSRRGYGTTASRALKDEIRTYFEDDNKRLEKWIWRPDRSHVGS